MTRKKKKGWIETALPHYRDSERVYQKEDFGKIAIGLFVAFIIFSVVPWLLALLLFRVMG